METHIRTFHTNGESRLRRRKKKFTAQFNPEHQIKKAMEPDLETYYVCGLCGAHFRTRDRLETHMQYMHEI